MRIIARHNLYIYIIYKIYIILVTKFVPMPMVRYYKMTITFDVAVILYLFYSFQKFSIMGRENFVFATNKRVRFFNTAIDAIFKNWHALQLAVAHVS